MIFQDGALEMNICVNTQTPLIRFNMSYPELVEKYGTLPEAVDVGMLEEGEDYYFSPGGVTAMVYPLLRRMKEEGIVERAMWVSLSPESPPLLTADGIDFVNIDMEREEKEGYVRFKDRLWNEIHGIERLRFISKEYLAFNQYSWRTADILLKNLENYDLFYIHDFQQLQIGNFVGPFAPAVYRWHIPANFDHVSERVRRFIVRNMEAYDAMIVSTKKDLEALFRAGYRGEAYQVYPHVDNERWRQATADGKTRFLSRSGLTEKDRFFLVVARMDPMKSQDIAIKALVTVRRHFPDVKLVLVGNGSFSGSRGLGSSKASSWVRKLKDLVSVLQLNDAVILTGHLDEEMLLAAYELCSAVILPSKMEGFGLVTVEAWLMKRPVIVSSGAGSAELVVDGLNGYTFQTENEIELAERMISLLKSDRGEEMGRMGFETAKQCYVEHAVRKLKEIFEKVISLY